MKRNIVGKNQIRSVSSLMLRFLFFSLIFICIHPVAASEFDIRSYFNQKALKTATIQASFKQTKKISFLSNPLVSEGSFIFVKGHGLVWQIDTPYPTKTVVTGKDLFSIDSHSQFTLIDDPQLKTVADIIRDTFTGEWSSIDSLFLFQQESGSTLEEWRFSLFPKSILLKKAVQSIEFQGTKGMIRSILFTDTKNNTTQLILKQLIEKEKVDASLVALFRQATMMQR